MNTDPTLDKTAPDSPSGQQVPESVANAPTVPEALPTGPTAAPAGDSSGTLEVPSRPNALAVGSPTGASKTANTAPSLPGKTNDTAGSAVDSATSRTADTIVPDTVPRGMALGKASLATHLKSAGRYLLKQFHARGGMGEVWVAQDTDIGRVVALKKVRQGREGDSSQFLHEAQITGQLEHPGIVPVHELGLDERGQPFYVMKFVHGRTLNAAIEEYHAACAKTGTPCEVELLKLLQSFIQLCQTMAYAHHRNVIHRDLKPDNVMVGQFGETLVLDWGLAKVVGKELPEGDETWASIRLSGDGNSELTEAGTVKGTPSYMSPEAACGKVSEIDQSSDIYLLGGCLYHILTGKKPRHAAKLSDMLQMARTQLPVAPRRIDPAIPRPLDAICMKALALAKTDRYASAAELAQDVERYLAGEPVTAYQENLIERARRWARVHRTALGRAAVGMVFVILAGFGIWALRAAEERHQEELRKEAAISAAKTKAAEEREVAAERKAYDLARVRAAKNDLARFRLLQEETQFLAIVYESADGRDSLYGLPAAEAKAREAIAALASWRETLDDLPLDTGEKVIARRDLGDLLLQTGQLILFRAATPAAGQEVLALLERAQMLHPQLNYFWTLRASAYEATGDREKAAEAASFANPGANARGAGARAVDCYLLGNQLLHDALGTPAQRDQIVAKAVEQYAKAIERDPEYYFAYWQLGRCFQLLGLRDKAAESLAVCAAMRPVGPSGYTLRGIALMTLNREQEGLASFDRALSLARDFRPARLHRGAMELLKKRYDPALADLDVVLAPPLEQRLLPAAYFRGVLHLEKAEWDKALADFDLAVTDKNPIPDAFLKRAATCFRLGKFDDGVKSIDDYLHATSGKELAGTALHEGRGRQLHALAASLSGKIKGDSLRLALAELKAASAESQPSGSLLAELGTIQDVLGDSAAAVEAYSAALERVPGNVKVLLKRGWARDGLNPPQTRPALEDFDAVLRIDPANAEAHTGAGFMQATLKHSDMALRHVNQALLHGAGDYLVLHNVACIYARLSDVEPARKVAFEDLALDQLQRAVELWKKSSAGPNEVHLIQGEAAFGASLRARPEFQRLTVEKATGKN
jgi:tetratricopeptide (TPR) repeat protein